MTTANHDWRVTSAELDTAQTGPHTSEGIWSRFARGWLLIGFPSGCLGLLFGKHHSWLIHR